MIASRGYRTILLIFLATLVSCSTKKIAQSLTAEFDTIALIEIPAGTATKYELDKSTKKLSVEIIDGQPRSVDYLPYPFNYGMIPHTLLPKSKGGDGDPLDILVLGSALKKEQQIACKVIGILKLMDSGEQDDKLIAVPRFSNFSHISSLADLNLSYPGITEIIETWFTNYKGEGVIISLGYEDQNAARDILTLAKSEYTKNNPN